MKSKEEFIKKFKNDIAGMALYGYVSDQKEGPCERVTHIFKIIPEVESKLAEMWTWLNGPIPPPQQPAPTQTSINPQQLNGRLPPSMVVKNP
jgi:hypothetical protein